MYCSGCGFALAQGQTVCPQCGRPVAAPIPAPPIPGFEIQLQSYSSQIRALSIVWFVYAGLTLLFGFLGLAFAKAMLRHHFGPMWMHSPWGSGMGGPFPNSWFALAVLRFGWLFVIGRTALALAAAWGLHDRAPWGRIVAIIAAVFSLLKFPIGTALGIWTLVMLLGYRNTTLYDRLPQS